MVVDYYSNLTHERLVLDNELSTCFDLFIFLVFDVHLWTKSYVCKFIYLLFCWHVIHKYMNKMYDKQIC